MVEVNGTPLLCNALNNVTALGVSEVGIVVGHMADYIKEHIGSEWNGVPVRYFENKRYLETNNVVSLYMAADFCDDDMRRKSCNMRLFRLAITCRQNMTSTVHLPAQLS